MELNEKNMELIGDYLQGRLNGDQLSQFLQDVEANPELKKELKLQQAIQDGIEHRHNLQLRSRFNKIAKAEKQTKTTTKVVSLKFYRIVASIAAVLVLCFGAYFLFSPSHDSNEIYANNFEPSELSITRSTDIDEQLAQLKELYNTQQYDQALPLFAEVISKEPTSNLRLAYGSALLKSKKMKEAEIQFKAILDAKDPLYSDQSIWYLSLLELNKGDIEASIKYLNELVSDPNSDYHEEAQTTLEEINSIK